jgi:hypothetical protein
MNPCVIRVWKFSTNSTTDKDIGQGSGSANVMRLEVETLLNMLKDVRRSKNGDGTVQTELIGLMAEPVGEVVWRIEISHELEGQYGADVLLITKREFDAKMMLE